jgi:serine/threonine protein phosphatase 1
MMAEQSLFASLRAGTRIWAVPAVHGEVGALAALHGALHSEFAVGDQLVYLGNYTGHGPRARETVDELLLFRRALLARPGMDVEHIVYLRGAQEEMWQKLSQVQFAPNPREVLKWMEGEGLGPTIEAYGGRMQEAHGSARDGILALTRFTSRISATFRGHDGHAQLMSALMHAAFTEDQTLLFVHAGIDTQRPLSAQADSFWWGGAGFAGIDSPYENYRRIVRGYDRRHGGFQETSFTVTLDAGCGFGGPLIAGCFGPDGGFEGTLTA